MRGGGRFVGLMVFALAINLSGCGDDGEPGGSDGGAVDISSSEDLSLQVDGEAIKDDVPSGEDLAQEDLEPPEDLGQEDGPAAEDLGQEDGIIVQADSQVGEVTPDGAIENLPGPEGGVFEGCGIKLVIPAGALEETVEITCHTAEDYPPNPSIVGTPVTLEPALTFAAEAKLSIYHQEASGEGLTMASSTGEAWRMLPGAAALADETNPALVAQVSELGTFTLIRSDAEGLLVPPLMTDVTQSEEYLPLGLETPVLLSWTYLYPPNPAPTCAIEGIGEVSPGDEVTFAITEESNHFTLICSNSAGEAAASVEFEPSVAPDIKFLYPSPPVLTAEATQVTWTWSYHQQPQPEPTCVMDHGIGEIKNGDVVEVQIGLLELDRGFTLTCTNNAGESTKTFLILPLPNISLDLTIPAAGASLALGDLVSLTIPEGAVDVDTVIHFEFTTDFPPSPRFITHPFRITPEGTTFNRPIELKVKYAANLLEQLGINVPELILRISTVGEEGSWLDLAATVDPEEAQITVQLSHLSTYAGSSGDRKDKEPLRSQNNIFERFDELALFTPYAGSQAKDFIQVKENAAQDPNMETIRTLGEHVCTREPNIKHARLLRVVPGDFDGDGQQEWAALCLFSNERLPVGDSMCRERYHIKVTFMDDKAENYAIMGRLYSTESASGMNLGTNDKSYYTADIAVGNFYGGKADQLFVMGSYCSKNDGNFKRDSTNIYFFKDATENFGHIETRTTPMNGVVDGRASAGDTDGDGVDELLYMGYRPSGDEKGPVAWIYDDWREGNYGRLKKWRATDYAAKVFSHGSSTMNGAMADVDGDGKAEFYFMALNNDEPYKIDVWDSREEQRDSNGEIIKDSSGNPQWDPDKSFARLERKDLFSTPYNTSFERNHQPQIAVGDFDGDFRQDIAFLVYQEYTRSAGANNYGWLAGVYYYYTIDDRDTPAKKAEYIQENSYKKGYLAVGDVDDDFRDEIFIGYVDTTVEVESDPWSGEEYTEVEDDEYKFKEFDLYINPNNVGDKRWELRKSWTVPFTRQTNPDQDNLSESEKIDLNKHYPMIVVNDVDGDNISLSYADEWKDNKTDPIPIIALAATPYWQAILDDYPENISSCYTEYGKGYESSQTESRTIGMQTGVTLSSELTASYKFLNAGVRRAKSVETTYTETTSKRKSVKTCTKHRLAGIMSNGQPIMNNAVVYQRQDFVSYKYNITAHPDPDLAPTCSNGQWTYKTMWIDVPNGGPAIAKATQGEYNNLVEAIRQDNPDTRSPLLDDEVFSFTMGNVSTYPTIDDANAIVKESSSDQGSYGGWVNDSRVSIGTAGGYETQSIQVSESTLNEWNESIVETSGWGFVIPIAGGHDYSEGTVSEETYSIEVGEESYYEGALADAPEGCFNLNTGEAAGPCAAYTYLDESGLEQPIYSYYFGIFVYNYEPSDENLYGFQVLHYWVDYQ